MARMPMPRDRAAPMDWERENTTNFPNVLDSSESTGFDAAGPQHDSPMNGRSSTFGQRGTSSTKASGTIPLNKGSEDPAQSKRPFSDVWGSATPRPLRQDWLQGSSSPDPPQPPALGGPLFFGATKRASTFSAPPTDTTNAPPGKQSTLKRSETQPAQSSSSTKDPKASPSVFSSGPKDRAQRDHDDDEGFDPDTQTPTSFGRSLSMISPWGSSRSSVMAEEIMKGTHELSIGGRSRPLATGAIKRVLRNRNAMGESEYWNVHADDSLYHQDRSDSDSEDRHRGTHRGIKSKSISFSNAALTTSKRRNALDRAGPRSHRPTPTLQHARSWQENVDLPFILSGYAQLLLNMVLFGCLFVIGYNAYAAIQDDISLEVDEMARRRLRTYKDCEYNYYRHFNCETPSDGALPFCRKYQQCMDENRSPLVGKAVASAHTFAAIANAFAHTLTFKAMFFFLILFLGGIFVSNYVLNSYRSNYVLHHQHHIAPGTLPKGGAPFTEPKDRKESNSSSFFSRARMGDKDSTDSSRIGRITDDGASRRLLPARSGLSSCMDDGDSSGSDGDIPSTRRVLALTSS